ncbi:MAG: hypothetical protein EOS56_20480 [Mesorhizobium sp.]|nr:MAG: hypothetical protein EOS56_20480 [Mesorhizobium sp.]RWC62973.1 MAG: hypothetical protein EOS29_15690 [Mesorhizobium sp.]
MIRKCKTRFSWTNGFVCPKIMLKQRDRAVRRFRETTSRSNAAPSPAPPPSSAAGSRPWPA